MKHASLLSVAALSISLAVMGCRSDDGGSGNMPHHEATNKDEKPNRTTTAIATIKPAQIAATQPTKNIAGTVTFTQLGDKVTVVADITGLEANSTHGIHIHEKPDLSAPDLMSTGGHYNPDHLTHGGAMAGMTHAGDLGNLTSDANGHARLEVVKSDISLGGMKNDVLGLPVIIHAGADDLKSQPAGNSGPRVAGGLIELRK